MAANKLAANKMAANKMAANKLAVSLKTAAAGLSVITAPPAGLKSLGRLYASLRNRIQRHRGTAYPYCMLITPNKKRNCCAAFKAAESSAGENLKWDCWRTTDAIVHFCCRLQLSMEETYVRHIELLGFEKRSYPSQHFVYMLMVKWNDLSEKLIYRTYPEIYIFHKLLKEMFPIESGEIEKKDRIIPSLPAPRWLISQKSPETRQSTLAEYFHSLIDLPPHISRCRQLSRFLRVRPEDENPPAPNALKKNETFVVSRELARGNASEISGPIILDTYRVIADFTKTSKHEVDLHTGDLVEIVEKNQNGWWFCQCESKRGWIPASYLEPLDGPEEAEEDDPNYEGEMFVTSRAYKAEQEDELSLEIGETIAVIHKLLDGWWVVRKGDETGHFPSMFLHKAGKREIYEAERTNLQGRKPPPRRSTIRNAKSIHNKARQRLSQDSYRRNSRRYLQQRGGRLAEPKGNANNAAKSPLRERKNQDNVPETSGSSSESEPRKEAPVVPPRPSPELILERCSDNTRKKVSIHRTNR